ncbi:DUF2281 domain-containing protein [Gloeocapsa sp. BRSZ]
MNSQTTTLPQKLLMQLQLLPPEQKQQVIDFVEFLHQKYGASQSEQATVKQPRVLGLHQGKGWISEDFNDPLLKLP